MDLRNQRKRQFKPMLTLGSTVRMIGLGYLLLHGYQSHVKRWFSQ